MRTLWTAQEPWSSAAASHFIVHPRLRLRPPPRQLRPQHKRQRKWRPVGWNGCYKRRTTPLTWSSADMFSLRWKNLRRDESRLRVRASTEECIHSTATPVAWWWVTFNLISVIRPYNRGGYNMHIGRQSQTQCPRANIGALEASCVDKTRRDFACWHNIHYS